MRDKLIQRLKELRAESESGRKILNDLEARQENVRSSLLRISGAIQVLEEALGAQQEEEASNSEKRENVAV